MLFDIWHITTTVIYSEKFQYFFDPIKLNNLALKGFIVCDYYFLGELLVVL